MKRTTEDLLSIVGADFGLSRGHPLPLGATLQRGGINFSVFSRHGTGVTLVIFLPGQEESLVEFPLDPRYNRTGDVWHVFIRGLDPGIEYGYRIERTPNSEPHLHRFDRDHVLIDPYARALSGGSEWGKTLHLETRLSPAGALRRRNSLVIDDYFDWQMDQPLNIHLADSIIYEMHVRGFTRHPSSQGKHPGTFLGIVEKIPYLKELGITAVELMPVTEFEENDNPNANPYTGEPLKNFWGYHPISFAAPKASYARGNSGNQVKEFKTMVKALHEAGIEVLLDVVLNHTSEGDERGPTVSFRGLDNSIYYIIDPQNGQYANYSGCGNTLNCNHPVVRDLIIDCLRYWVTEMHVDGFRFDLASILGRGRNGSVLSDPPLLERLAADPVLANTKLIAEAWDAAGLYQVGNFPNWGRWAEWNGKFRDDIRRFVKSDAGMSRAFALRMAGSPDLYREGGRAPFHSINFITCHDGFTLADLVSYNAKHNEANGEGNRDGSNENHSWNCGEEGPSATPEINALRRRQMKNMAALLLLSQGVPMILAGDEMGRTQHGNNNAYCQDNETSWMKWDLLACNSDLFRFFKLLIQFRKKHRALRNRAFFGDSGNGAPSVAWQGLRPGHHDWSWESRSLAMHIFGGEAEEDICILANAHWECGRFELPVPSRGGKWFRFIDTMLQPPGEICEEGAEQPLEDPHQYDAGPRSIVVLLAK